MHHHLAQRPLALSARRTALACMPTQPALQPELLSCQQQVFEYIGSRVLTVVAPKTGRCYHFGYPGAMLSVDARDVVTLLGIRSLRVSRAR